MVAPRPFRQRVKFTEAVIVTAELDEPCSEETRAEVEAIGRAQERHKQAGAAKQCDHLQYVGLGFGVRYAVQSLDKCSHGNLQNSTSAEADWTIASLRFRRFSRGSKNGFGNVSLDVRRNDHRSGGDPPTSSLEIGRGSWIRTNDLQYPKQAPAVDNPGHRRPTGFADATRQNGSKNGATRLMAGWMPMALQSQRR